MGHSDIKGSLLPTLTGAVVSTQESTHMFHVRKCFFFDGAFRHRWRGVSFQNVWSLRLDDGGGGERSMLCLTLSVELYSDRSVCLSNVVHTQPSTLNSHTSVKYAQSKPINLCNCAFGSQLVSKASFYCWTQCLVFRQMPFRSTRPQSVLCSRKGRCLTEPNNIFPTVHTLPQKYATKAHPINFTVQEHDKNTVV